jgi:hypothetical protein
MALPPRHPDPLTADDYLKELKGGVEGLYVLGSFNRYITVHSQQIRAVNLIHALVEKTGPHVDKDVAIIGAGFAGVTAAAYALERTNAAVTVFEAAPRALWLQEHCWERWLHPGLYDWPLPGSLEPRTYLPVMNWTTGPAHQVVAQVREQWNEALSRKANLTCHFNSPVSAVKPAKNGRLSVTVNAPMDLPDYDVVILAVGFGLEDAGLEQPSYWNDIDGLLRPSGSVLISGFGDGGLADLLRLCLPSYRQDRLIELVRGIDEETSAKIVDAERTLAGNQADLNSFYERLEVDTVIEWLRDEPTGAPEVTIAGAGALYGTTSAILNRFLVSQLAHARPSAFSVLPKKTANVTPQRDGLKVTFDDGTERVFNHAILRHGPRAAVDRIDGVLEPSIAVEQRRRWRGLPQALDRTRVPLFSRPAAIDEIDSNFRSLSSYESSGDPWCLLIAPENSTHWPLLAQNVLNRIAHPSEGEGKPVQIATEPLYIRAEDAVSGEASYRAVVRALCTADVLLADVGKFDNPAVMMLLGIRAAVRRGVSVICTNSPITDEVWRQVPFNIREIKPISLWESEKRVRDLADAIRDGLGQSQQQATYLDLPVYEYVRKLVPDESPGKTPVLYLRSFSENYRNRNLEGVRQNLETALSKAFPGSRLYSVIDEASPRLASQRLYSAMRHRELCVIDWTEWRANVFFEMGARLASHPRFPLCILTEPSGVIVAHRKLSDLLSPFVYESAGKLSKFKTAVDKYVKERQSLRNHAFEVATQFFDARQEGYRTRVDENLSASANATVDGRDPLQTVEVNVLYANRNPNLTRQVLSSSFEHLCAAWCYLDEREAPHLWDRSALLDPGNYANFVRYRDLGLRLRSALETRYDDRDKRLLARIRERQHATQKLNALAAGLNQWRQLRDQIDDALEELSREELEAAVDQLIKLKKQIVDLGSSPASVILRQGLDHDLHVLEQALKTSGATG